MAKTKAASAAAAPKSTVSADRIAPQTLIFDNGAHSIKAGFSTPSTEDLSPLSSCHIIPNCIARSVRDKLTYVGADLDTCGDFGEIQIRRPVEKGYIVNWEGEKAIWERTIFNSQSAVQCDPNVTNLILTEAPNAPTALQRNADEMVFEEFGFAALWRVAAPVLTAYAPSPLPSVTSPPPAGTPLEMVLAVDCGHSHTTVTPLYHGRALQSACRRLEVGGKLLTNHLQNQLSRTMDMHREDWISQEIKEDVCFVAEDSADFSDLLERVWKGGRKDPREVDVSVVVDYVLPDYEVLKRGFARAHDPSKSARLRRLGIGGPSEMVLVVGSERFAVPEVLFTPSDIGMQQEGLAGTVMQSLAAVPKGLWQGFLASVVVQGGTSRMKGVVERLESDLRKLVDEKYVVRVARAEDPVKNVWLGGARLAQNEDLLRSLVVTKQEYLEHGDLWTRRKFAGKVNR
jgi:actin-related protein 6